MAIKTRCLGVIILTTLLWSACENPTSSDTTPDEVVPVSIYDVIRQNGVMTYPSTMEIEGVLTGVGFGDWNAHIQSPGSNKGVNIRSVGKVPAGLASGDRIRVIFDEVQEWNNLLQVMTATAQVSDVISSGNEIKFDVVTSISSEMQGNVVRLNDVTIESELNNASNGTINGVAARNETRVTIAPGSYQYIQGVVGQYQDVTQLLLYDSTFSLGPIVDP